MTRPLLLAALLLSVLSQALAGCDNGGGGPAATAAPGVTPVRGSITVFAASSLTDAFTDLGRAFEAANPDAHVDFNFAGSPTLVTQLDQGAPADVLATADQSNMDVAFDNHLTVDAGRTFARNRLAVIVPRDNPADIASPYDLGRSGLRLVLAQEDVPVGKYARQALDKMEASAEGGAGFKDRVLGNVVSDEPNVRAVVTKVQLGEADAGIAYVTDVASAEDVLQIAIPDGVNVIAQYPIALASGAAESRTAQAFIEFVRSSRGQAVLQQYGFLAP